MNKWMEEIKEGGKKGRREEREKRKKEKKGTLETRVPYLYDKATQVGKSRDRLPLGGRHQRNHPIPEVSRNRWGNRGKKKKRNFI